MSKQLPASKTGEQSVIQNVSSETLTRTGSFFLWLTVLMTIARIGLTVLPFIFILGAENWVVLYFVIFYTILFGINFIFYLGLFSVAQVTKEDANKIFGVNFVTWNPLRRFYAVCLFCFVDYPVNLAVWYSWLTKNSEYLNSPNNSNTPNVNSPGFFSFQILCGAFIFSSVIYAVLAYQFMRSLRNQRQDVIPVDQKGLSPAQLSALGQIAKKKKILVNVELSGDSAPGMAEVTEGRVKRYWFTGITVIWIVTLLVYLFIYFVHTFDGATKMQFVVITVFFWVSLFFWLVLVVLYYAPFYNSPSIRDLITRMPTNKNISTAETNAELNYEMGGVFVSTLIFYFINIIFMIYAYVLDGPNKLEWNTVPKFNPLAVIQSPFFYVFITNGALNTGAIVFFAYNFVTIGFVIGWGAPALSEESATEAGTDKSKEEDELLEQPGAPGNFIYYSDSWVIGVTVFMFAVWFVFFGFIIDAMIGGHFLAEYIWGVAWGFTIVFFILIVVIYVLSIYNVRKLNDGEESDGRFGIWRLNKTWFLSTYRTMVSVPVAFVLQVIILWYLQWDCFQTKRVSDWTVIRPIDPSTPPPYESCNIYWAINILSLYCINLVYLVIACNQAATTSIRVQVFNQAKVVEKGSKKK